MDRDFFKHCKQVGKCFAYEGVLYEPIYSTDEFTILMLVCRGPEQAE